MDFPESHYYKENKFLMSIIGQWPEKPRKFNYFIRFVILLMFLQSITFQTLAIIESSFDSVVTYDVWPILMVMILLFVSAIICYCSEYKFIEMWNRLKEDWAGERIDEETRIKVKIAEQTRVITLILFVLVVLGTIIFVLVSTFFSELLDILMPLNETRQHIHPFIEYVFIDRQKYFYPLVIKCQFATVCSLTFGVANQAMLIVYSQHIHGMFKVLGYRLENLIPDYICESKYESTALYAIFHHSLKLSLERHKRVLEFSTIIESYYAPVFALSLVQSILIITPTFVQLAEVKEIDYKTILTLIILSCFLFSINYMGQRLIDISTGISKKAYLSRWYLALPRQQRILIILIRRCDIPCTVSAYSLYVASLDCFRMVMQTGISYCMAIRKFRG